MEEHGPGRVSIYPNPTDGQLTIEFSKPVKEGKMLITDLSGRKLLERELQMHSKGCSLDTGPLEKGVYLLQLASDRVYLVSRIIVK